MKEENEEDHSEEKTYFYKGDRAWDYPMRRTKRQGRKGVFFSLDAFMAISILIMGIAVVLSFFFASPFKSQVYFYAQDVNQLFATTKISSINDNNYTVLRKDKADGNITNADHTIYQQIAEFYYRNASKGCADCLSDVAWNFTKDITHNLLSDRVSYEILLYPDPIGNSSDYRVIYERLGWGTDTSQANSTLITSAKSIVSGRYNDTEFYGPYLMEVRVWQ